MLILERRIDEGVSLVIDGVRIWVIPIRIGAEKVHLGVDAPREVVVEREEIVAPGSRRQRPARPHGRVEPAGVGPGVPEDGGSLPDLAPRPELGMDPGCGVCGKDARRIRLRAVVQEGRIERMTKAIRLCGDCAVAAGLTEQEGYPIDLGELLSCLRDAVAGAVRWLGKRK
jgi:carbon storage regulator CsrA